jgi:outer membrane biosynthesis protein TonB
VGALLQLAAISAQRLDLQGAQRFYQLTGLTDQQCALVDAEPVRIRGKASQDDYPEEARAWGISGWAKTEFDIRANGATEHVRTVMAYPPFVFGRPMEEVAARLKYTQSYRPDGGLGCGGQSYQQGFHYVTR